MVKSIIPHVVVPLMQCIMLDLYKAQTPKLQPWFKETREAKFGPLDQASTALHGLLSPRGPCFARGPGQKALNFARKATIQSDR